MSEVYKKGFENGIKFSIDNWNPQTGYYKNAFPSNFVHRGDVWSCGFGEGLITGRNQVITKTFGEFKSLSWDNGRVTVVR